jgi:hypothetical protein
MFPRLYKRIASASVVVKMKTKISFYHKKEDSASVELKRPSNSEKGLTNGTTNEIKTLMHIKRNGL